MVNATFRLHNGVLIPSLGFGTWQIPEGGTAYKSVRDALSAGYTHIDTATIYGNEQSVGKAIAESGVDRKNLFITTKVWNSDRGYDKALRAFEQSMRKLGLEYLDLYLIHWPAVRGDNKQQVNTETWRALEYLYKSEKIRAIGLSNFLPHHIQPLLDVAEVAPMVDQIEYHPGMMQQETVDYCRSNKILVEAWSPLGSGRVLGDPGLVRIAQRYGKSVAQLCIRWCLQNEVLPLPKSATTQRIQENLQVFDFAISDEDMAEINHMPLFGSSGLHPDEVDF